MIRSYPGTEAETRKGPRFRDADIQFRHFYIEFSAFNLRPYSQGRIEDIPFIRDKGKYVFIRNLRKLQFHLILIKFK